MVIKQKSYLIQIFLKFIILIENDLRRLEFISAWFEEIIISELKSVTNDTNERTNVLLNNFFLRDLIEYRRLKTEMCNMILVLLVVNV